MESWHSPRLKPINDRAVSERRELLRTGTEIIAHRAANECIVPTPADRCLINDYLKQSTTCRFLRTLLRKYVQQLPLSGVTPDAFTLGVTGR
jgi:hypothetical protein